MNTRRPTGPAGPGSSDPDTGPRSFPSPEWGVTLACWLAAVVMGLALPSRAADVEPPPASGASYAAPEQAVEALVSAARNQDRAALRQVLGLESDGLVAADQVQMTNELAEFLAAFDVSHHLIEAGNDRQILEIGPRAWPFPIPLARRTDGRWQFDTAAGRDELINRRIGRNELQAIDVIRASVSAQREYASQDRDGDDVLEFAARLSSRPGTRDGLYWPPELDGQTSPLGPLAARAQDEGYRSRRPEEPPAPFHGYFFRILTRQGRHAPGGKHGYFINGNMIAGFALVAWPVQYGESGIMTFIVNQQGRIYQKDLGPKTARRVAAMTQYDPDATWSEATPY